MKNYNIKNLKSIFRSKISLIFNKQWLLRKHFWQLLHPSLDDNKIIAFVAGNQRSGTNMLMDMIEKNIETQVFHEIDRRAFKDYLMRDHETIHYLIEKSKARCVVFKSLCESQDIPELLEKFTPARAIWVVRGFNDVAKSMAKSFPKHRSLMLKIATDADAGAWRTKRMSSSTYEKIKHCIDHNIDNESAAALQWYMRNILYFERKMFENKNIMLVIYEDLVASPVLQSQRICRFLGLTPNNFMIADLNTNSVKRTSQSTISPDVKRLCEPLWNEFLTIARIDYENN